MSTPEQARRELNRELQEWIADPGAVVAITAAIEALIDAKLTDLFPSASPPKERGKSVPCIHELAP